jgi:hypothetical protein
VISRSKSVLSHKHVQQNQKKARLQRKETKKFKEWKNRSQTSNIERSQQKRQSPFHDSEIEEPNSPPANHARGPHPNSLTQAGQKRQAPPLLRPSRSISPKKKPRLWLSAACAKAAWVAWVASRSGILASRASNALMMGVPRLGVHVVWVSRAGNCKSLHGVLWIARKSMGDRSFAL